MGGFNLRFRTVSIMVLIFITGWILSSAYSTSRFDNQLERTQSLTSLVSQPQDVPSPQDRIKENQIHVTDNRVVIDIKNAEWATFTSTKSMDPVIDSGANAIEIVPADPSEIQPGDIVSYQSRYSDGVIIHRIAKINYDEEGWYATFKGDNLPKEDPEKVRFSQIRRVVVAIIY